MQSVTQYAVQYQGQVDLALTYPNRDSAEAYIYDAVLRGQEPADYAIVHRTITYGDWSLTTLSPSLLECARQQHAAEQLTPEEIRDSEDAGIRMDGQL